MNHFQKIQVLLNFILLSSIALGQSHNTDSTSSIGLRPDFVAEKVADVATTRRGSNWLTFRQDARIPPRTIFDEHRDAFYLGNDDRMDIVREKVDDIGFTHYRYQQIYKGVKVEGAEMLVHAPRLFIGDNNNEA